MPTRSERALALFLEPEFFDSIVEKIAEGATLADICKQHDIPYGMTHSWIRGEDSRAERYDQAVEARSAFLSDRVISSIMSVSTATVKDMLDDDGNVRDLSTLSDAAAYAIQSIEVETDQTGARTKKIRMHDKMKAVEMAGRNQKMFTDKVEHGGQVGLADLVAASMVKPEATK